MNIKPIAKNICQKALIATQDTGKMIFKPFEKTPGDTYKNTVQSGLKPNKYSIAGGVVWFGALMLSIKCIKEIKDKVKEIKDKD